VQAVELGVADRLFPGFRGGCQGGSRVVSGWVQFQGGLIFLCVVERLLGVDEVLVQAVELGVADRLFPWGVGGRRLG
jgi:hypothetical protein